MVFLYDLTTKIFFWSVGLVAMFSPKAKKLKVGQKNLVSHIRSTFISNKKQVIWVHAASLGEFEQGRPVMEAIKREFADAAIVLTFFSPSGYEVRRNYHGADYVYYLPFDGRSNAASFLKTINPSLGIIIKYEFWYHYITCAHSMGIPLISISSIFKPTQPFFKFYGGLHRKMLLALDHFFVQNEQSAELLRGIGISNCTVSGDTRYDRVNDQVKIAQQLPIVEQFINGKATLVAGSTWPDDMEMLLPILFKNKSRYKAVIAPHEISPDSTAKLKASLPRSIQYSECSLSTQFSNYDYLIIDNVGMLAAIYGYATLAYVGGGLHGGLHNTLEAAAWGIPVIFGKHGKNSKFQEAADLLTNGGGFEVVNSAEFEGIFGQLMADEPLRKAVSESAKRQVLSNLGATGHIMDYIRKKLG